MGSTRTPSTRRAFFLQGGAALGAGIAGAAALQPAEAATQPDQMTALRQQLDARTDHEAIQRLQLEFMALVESGSYEAAVDLFDRQSQAAMRQRFDQYRSRAASVIHSVYRPNSLQQADTITLDDDRLRATATFHVDVQLTTPLQGDSTVATMARLQGQVADLRWESGRIDATYVKTQGEWKMASQRYIAG